MSGHVLKLTDEARAVAEKHDYAVTHLTTNLPCGAEGMNALLLCNTITVLLVAILAFVYKVWDMEKSVWWKKGVIWALAVVAAGADIAIKIATLWCGTKTTANITYRVVDLAVGLFVKAVMPFTDFAKLWRETKKTTSRAATWVGIFMAPIITVLAFAYNPLKKFLGKLAKLVTKKQKAEDGEETELVERGEGTRPLFPDQDLAAIRRRGGGENWSDPQH